MHKVKQLYRRSAFAGVLVLGFTMGALAQGAGFSISVDMAGDPGASWTGTPTLSVDSLGMYTVADGSHTVPGAYEVKWQDVHGDLDPATFAFVTVTNLSNATQTYNNIYGITGAVLPGPGNVMQGSVQGGVTDTSLATGFGGAGATLATAGAGTALYVGLIDGNPALPLLSDPTSVVAAANGSNSTSANSGFLAAPAVTTSISIRHQFTLSPGDTATFSSFFQVVPEPTTIGLLGLGSLLLMRRRR